MKFFFVTGTYRSGTTLVENLISIHPQIFSANQPFFTLFIRLKKNFLEHMNIEDPLPLGHYFGENRYRPSEFYDFLKSYKITTEDIESSYQGIEKFDGVKTKEILKVKEKLVDNVGLLDFYKNYVYHLSKVFSKENVEVFGSKENLCEDYIQYFIENKTKVILVLRDIRDVINSTNFGKGYIYNGEPRPTLFTIRVWRKSIAFAQFFMSNPYLLVIKYEDLVREPQKHLKQIYKFLEVDEKFAEDLNKLNIGSNSSFESYKGISSKSIGKFRANPFFTEKNLRYIEFLSYPEMLITNYKPQIVNKQDYKDITFDQLSEFEEVKTKLHRLFDRDYSIKKTNLMDEITRRNLLFENPDVKDILRFFIFEEVYYKLKKIV